MGRVPFDLFFTFWSILCRRRGAVTVISTGKVNSYRWADDSWGVGSEGPEEERRSDGVRACSEEKESKRLAKQREERKTEEERRQQAYKQVWEE